jgi:hypothetical protein
MSSFSFPPALAGEDWEARTKPVRLLPEMGSFTTGSNNLPGIVYENPPPFIEYLAKTYQETGVTPEIEVFETGMIANALFLQKKGYITDRIVNMLVCSDDDLSPGPLRASVLTDSSVTGHFNQIPVRIAKIKGPHEPSGSDSVDRPFLDEDPERPYLRHGLLEAVRGDEAQIRGSWYGISGLGLEFPAGLVQVDLLIAEAQGNPTVVKPHFLHSQRPAIELCRALDVRNGQHDVVNERDFHCYTLRALVSGYGYSMCFAVALETGSPQ